MKPVSEATARIARHNFSKKFIALGRVVEQWPEIMGAEFADKAQPVKLNYRKKSGSKKPTATLDIATSSAYATILPYQKGLILERINRIFGNDWITDVRFVPTTTNQKPVMQKKIKPPLTGNEKKYLSDILNEVKDQDIKERLQRLGKEIITERKK